MVKAVDLELNIIRGPNLRHTQHGTLNKEHGIKILFFLNNLLISSLCFQHLFDVHLATLETFIAFTFL